MKKLFIFFLFFSISAASQDKLFLKNGSVKKVVIVSIAQDVVFYKNSDTARQTEQILKTDLLLAENYKGDVFIFSGPKTAKSQITETPLYKRNALGLQPLGVFVGRLTLVYERFTKDAKIGFVFPLSLTFDPFSNLYKGIDTSGATTIPRNRGVNFIGGLDVNFYVGRKQFSRFFLGPRIRYGTDMFLEGIEAYSVQTQCGWMYGNPEKHFVQHLSLGFGVVRILSSSAGTRISPKQSYAWISINYRIGIKW